MLYQIVLGPPVQYFTFNIAFELGAWFERNPKKNLFKPASGENIFFNILKASNEDKLKIV